MGIVKHIEDLRQRPAHERKQRALIYSGCVTAVIFVVWLSVLIPRDLRNIADTTPDTDAIGDLGRDLSLAYQEASQGIVELKQQLGEGIGAPSQTAGAYNATVSGTTTAPTGPSGDAGAYLVPPATPGATSSPTYDFGY